MYLQVAMAAMLTMATIETIQRRKSQCPEMSQVWKTRPTKSKGGQAYTGCFFSLVPPLKVPSTKKLIQARLGVSRPIYVNIDTPNLGFPYFNFLGGYQLKKHPALESRDRTDRGGRWMSDEVNERLMTGGEESEERPFQALSIPFLGSVWAI